jgi:hypothetical protein
MKILMFSWNGNIDVNQFDYDLGFLQRYKKKSAEQLKQVNYYENNYKERGLCIVNNMHPNHHWNTEIKDTIVEARMFDDYIPDLKDDCQGSCFQIIKWCGVKFINASVCYPTDEVPISVYYNQSKQLLDLVDDNTVLLTDLHGEDYEIEEEKILSFKERNLTNHLSTFKAFTNKKGDELSLDKIITTKNCTYQISNINVLRPKKEDSDYGHWPIEFEIQFA